MWTAVHLTPAFQPVLRQNESVDFSADDATLYKEEEKLPIIGKVLLTQERLIYIVKSNRNRSMETSITSIADVEYVEPRFMRSSTKAIIRMNDSPAQVVQSWTCEICSFSNSGNTDICSTCGVRADIESINSNSTTLQSTKTGLCPKCTFQNHPSLQYCEMCLTPLKKLAIIDMGQYVKFGFPNKAGLELVRALKEILRGPNSVFADLPVITDSSRSTVSEPSETTSAENKLSYGLKKLQTLHEKDARKAHDSLGIALSSPEGFREVSRQIAHIAAKFNLRNDFHIPILSSTIGDDNTRIAKQLVDLLIGDDLLQHYGGMLSLHEVYVLYNRCRGFDLISPQKLVDALALCDELELPLNVREMGRMKVIESRGSSTTMLLRMIQYIKSESSMLSWRASCGFSARDISEKFGYSVQIATEELKLAERTGHLCRDEDISGLRFFINHFSDISTTSL